MIYKIKLEQFEGPLDLLLRLIEEEEMDITKVSLAKVTEQYLEYLNETENITTEELADFLVVAAKLLLIKSKYLLPQLQTDDDEENDLERQLKLYKEFYEASKVLHKMITKRKFSFSRERPALTMDRVFKPPKSLTTKKMQEIFASVLRELEPWVNLPSEVMAKTISIRERISSIQQMIKQQAELNFKHLMKSAANKTEVIVTFLALLELVKLRIIAVVQDKKFDDIVIKKVDNDL